MPLVGLGRNPKLLCRSTFPRESEQPRSGYEANGDYPLPGVVDGLPRAAPRA